MLLNPSILEERWGRSPFLTVALHFLKGLVARTIYNCIDW